jgi:hypothetical protein
MVNETLGNQSANMRRSFTRLAVATEDFALQSLKTDLAEALDDVPSGLCQWFRLNRKSGIHVEDTLSTPFRGYDVLGGLNDQIQKVAGEFFYVIFNEDSKRWEILQSAGIKLKYGIVRTCLGDGWYEIELSDWDEIPVTSDSISASLSSSDDPCDFCIIAPEEEAEGDSAGCDTVQAVIVERYVGTGTGEIVYAHTASLLTLLDGGHVKMIKRAAADSGSTSSSTSASSSLSVSASSSLSVSDAVITDRLYDIVDASKPLLSLPFPQYECCELPGGGQEVRLIRYDRAIVEGIKCPGISDPCPTSNSASESV